MSRWREKFFDLPWPSGVSSQPTEVREKGDGVERVAKNVHRQVQDEWTGRRERKYNDFRADEAPCKWTQVVPKELNLQCCSVPLIAITSVTIPQSKISTLGP